MYDASGTVLLKGTLTVPFLCISAPLTVVAAKCDDLGKRETDVLVFIQIIY